MYAICYVIILNMINKSVWTNHQQPILFYTANYSVNTQNVESFVIAAYFRELKRESQILMDYLY